MKKKLRTYERNEIDQSESNTLEKENKCFTLKRKISFKRKVNIIELKYKMVDCLFANFQRTV